VIETEGNTAMSEGKDRPKKQHDDFHETEYYSKFHEQEASLPGKTGGDDPSGEIDEETIQELMDATLTSGEGSGEFDTEIKADWIRAAAEGGSSERPVGSKISAKSSISPQKTIRRPEKGVVGKRKKPRRRKRWWRSSGRLWSIFKFLLFVALLAGLTGGVWYARVSNRNVFAELQKEASAKHSNGDFHGAIDAYRRLLESVPEGDLHGQARYSFLIGAAYEEAWKTGGSESDFRQAVEYFDRTVEIDRSELRVYAVESLLAKSEMAIERDRGEESRAMGMALLEELLSNPVYAANPTVYKGVPHRRLADLIREDDPTRAIALLEKAKANQGDLEEGYENIEIGLIYRDLLEDPDQAVEYFERVRHNELAPREVQNVAEDLLHQIQATDIGNSELFPERMMEFLPEKEVEP